MNPSDMEVGQGVLIRRPQPVHETPPMIINDISHLFHGKMRSVQTEGLLSQHGARMILATLAHHRGLRQTDLVRLTHMKAPTISVLIKKMEAEGLVTGTVLEDDQRAVRLQLTEKGQQLHEVTRAVLRATDEIMMQGFTQQETEQLKGYLNRVRSNLLADLEQNGLLRPAKAQDDGEEEARP